MAAMRTTTPRTYSVTSLRTPASRRSPCVAAEPVADAKKFIATGLVGLAAACALVVAPAVQPPQLMPQAQALLTAGDPVKNARAILRNALPVDNKPIRKVAQELESITESLRIPGKGAYGPVSRAVNSASKTFTSQQASIVKAFADDKKASGTAAIASLTTAFKDLEQAASAKGDKGDIFEYQQECLRYVGQIQEAMVKKFPFEVPAEYADLPQLKGRATLEMNYTLKESRDSPIPVTRSMLMVLDGYNAPVSAGCFYDLVQKDWYDGMEIQRADGFVVQTGKPKKGEFYTDPQTGQERKIPLEIKTAKDKEPVYEFSLEDLGRPNDQPILPFNAFGTLAWARSEFENNSASSQVFWLLKESELTPSGANLLDGRYAVFGYVVEMGTAWVAIQGQNDLLEMKVGDKINSIKVLDGAENFVKPKAQS